MNPTALVCALCALFLWGVSPLIYRYCTAGLSAWGMQAARSVGFFGGAAVLWLSVGLPPLHLFSAAALAVGGSAILGITIGDYFYFRSIALIGSGKAAAITSTYPFFVALLSVTVLGEHLSVTGWVGVMITVAGIILFRLLAGMEDEGSTSVLGFSVGLVAGLCWGITMLTVRWAVTATGLTTVSVTLLRSIGALFSSWIALWLSGRGKKGPLLLPWSDRRMWLMAIAGVLVMAVGGWISAQAMKLAPASLVSPITGSSPVITALLGRAFFNEKIAPMQWIGIAMILVGGVAINLA